MITCKEANTSKENRVIISSDLDLFIQQKTRKFLHLRNLQVLGLRSHMRLLLDESQRCMSLHHFEPKSGGFYIDLIPSRLIFPAGSVYVSAATIQLCEADLTIQPRL